MDSGMGFQQSHIQTIFPGHSELFDTIIDYEDTSDEAPHCVIKSFPSHIDHCLQWVCKIINTNVLEVETPIFSLNLLQKHIWGINSRVTLKIRDQELH